ncbi:uncharacterized protein LOC123320434 [Coccinella septempunctata]|uniref:uncharacterized protein LOC123320434 n=1 Tax=Coccinella septempunctata TaxID=41139 RepID=UPI001D08322E|nr:uncharacterized protein LOC123320434 [Coccinella septempunctata]
MLGRVTLDDNSYDGFCFFRVFAETMSSLGHKSLTDFVVLLCFLLCLLQVFGTPIDLDKDDEDELFLNKNIPHKRKSARMAFLEESDDPMFKFLTKILNTAQQRTKNRLVRAQNGMKETQELKTEVARKLRYNHLPIREYD